MKFKRNITIKYACIITECLISSIPAIFIVYLFFFRDKMDEIFSSLLIVQCFILITNAILILISFIAKIFIKTKYYVKNESLVIVTKTKKVEINYSEICGITYDFGYDSRFLSEPSQLVLFDKNYKELLKIKNPSIIMVDMIRQKCKHAIFSYYHNKRFLHLLLIINSTALIFCIIFKIYLKN